MACITNTPQQHKLAISAPHVFEVTPDATMIHAFPFLSNNHVWTPEFIEDEGNRGNPFLASEGVMYSRGSGSGAVTMIPRADDLRVILPLLLGGAFTINEIEPALNCNFFSMQAYKGISVFNHRDCKTNTFSFNSSSGSPLLTLEWNIESSKFVTAAEGSFTAGLDLSLMQPFVHSQSTVTIDAREYKVDDVSFAGNNELNTDLFYNSVTRTDMPTGRMRYTFTHTSPFDVAADVALMERGTLSAAATVVYTSGTTSMTIEFPALQSPIPSPITPAGTNTPVRLEGIQWEARSKGAGGTFETPLKITLDDTI
jgi:hypothetical protein